MDLYAYTQIEDLSFILKNQKIDVPRLRGLRLMKREEKFSQEDINNTIKEDGLYIVEHIVKFGSLCCSWYPNDPHKKQLKYDKDGYCVGYNFDKIHGWKRKKIKYELKKVKREVLKQYNLFNKFVGQDVLYVHARIGGGNWSWCKGWELTKHPDYLGHCDDSFDCTYCDLYFKLSESSLKLIEEKVNEQNL